MRLRHSKTFKNKLAAALSLQLEPFTALQAGRLLTGRCFDGWFGCTRQSKSLTKSTLNKFFWAKEKSLKIFPIYIICVQDVPLIRYSLVTVTEGYQRHFLNLVWINLVVHFRSQFLKQFFYRK